VLRDTDTPVRGRSCVRPFFSIAALHPYKGHHAHISLRVGRWLGLAPAAVMIWRPGGHH
jgi:hypothetical protein